MTRPLWRLERVCLPGRTRPRLSDVTLEIGPGVTAVMGCSGAGKTSLLNALVGFEEAQGILDFGFDAQIPQTRIQSPESRIQNPEPRLALYWVPPDGGLWAHLTAREHLSAVRPGHAEGLPTVDEWLERFGLLEVAESRPDRLSAGEASRLSVARALASDAAVLVMDEPLVHVDASRVGVYWAAIREHCSAWGASLVFATHSPEDVLREADRVICVDAGRVVWQGAVQELYDAPPTAELARFLGPANWLTADEAEQWLGTSLGREVCLRPERLRVVKVERSLRDRDDDPSADPKSCTRTESVPGLSGSQSDPAALGTGPRTFVVEDARFAGSVAEVELLDERRGERRRFFHRPSGDALARGMRVVLSASLALCLLLSLAGCDRSAQGRTLSIQSITYKALPNEGARLPAPRGLAFGPQRELYVLDDAGRVLIYNDHLALQDQWWMPEYSVGRPEGLVVLHDGRIAVADTHYHRIAFLDKQGQLLGAFGELGEGPGQFIYPEDVTQDAHGFLYVCEYGGNDRIQKFTADGGFVVQMGACGTGPGEFQRASGVVWHDGKVYACDAINNRVQVFTDDGQFVAILADAATADLQYPYHLAPGPDGTLYAIEYQAGRVTHLSLDGAVLGRFGTTGRGEHEFWTPWGIAVDDQGRIVVADTGNRRLVELKPSRDP